MDYCRTGENGKLLVMQALEGNPYCPVCEQKLGLLFHLTRILGKDSCPQCKAMYSAHLFGHDD